MLNRFGLLVIGITFIFSGCVNRGIVELRKFDNLKVVDINDSEFGYDKRVIKKGDSIAVRLRFSHIDDYVEWFNKDAEIAIVINTFELKNGQDIDFSRKGASQGRLVYYSDHIDVDQDLNHLNLPIYGPIEYGGNPFIIDIHVIELDTKKEQTKALLGTLASVGSIAYAPASPILAMLNKFGKSLIDANENDDIMRFTLMFDPEKPIKDKIPLFRPILSEGNYIFVKKDNNNETIDWSNLSLSLKHWKLENNTSTGNKIYSGHTYLGLQVIKGMNPLGLNLSEQNYGKFLKILEEEDIGKAKNYKKINDDFKVFFEKRAQNINYIKAKEMIGKFLNTDNNHTKIMYYKQLEKLVMETNTSKGVLSIDEKINIFESLSGSLKTDSNSTCKSMFLDFNISAKINCFKDN